MAVIEIEARSRIVNTVSAHSGSRPVRQYPAPPADREQDEQVRRELDGFKAVDAFEVVDDVIINPNRPDRIERRSAAMAVGSEIIHLVTMYKTELAVAGGAGLVALTALQKLLSILVSWRTLQEGRTFTITVDGKPIDVDDGIELKDLIEKIRSNI